jgi:hypothetical protein
VVGLATGNIVENDALVCGKRVGRVGIIVNKIWAVVWGPVMDRLLRVWGEKAILRARW